MTRLAAVTGAAGFIGGHVVGALEAAGWETAAVDLRPHRGAHRADIRRALVPATFARAEVVVHLAALGGVRPSWVRPREYHDTNVTGTAHVLAAARGAGVRRVVLASSSSVYGECAAGPVAEGAPLRPLSPYARTKVAAERLARAAAGPELEVVVVRPFTVYGPGQRPDMLVARLLARETLTLWPFARDLTFVGDLAPAIATACHVPVPGPCTVVNLGSGRAVTADQLLAAVAEVTGAWPSVRWGRPSRGEPTRTWADPTLARRWLGFDPATALVDGIAAQARSPHGAAPNPLTPIA